MTRPSSNSLLVLKNQTPISNTVNELISLGFGTVYKDETDDLILSFQIFIIKLVIITGLMIDSFLLFNLNAVCC